MADHKRLVLPGPVEVRKEILEAQTEWMIGHRSPQFSELFARLQDKLKKVFLTDHRVMIFGSSGTGVWEGASRNCIRDDKKALHLVSGSFSERWAKISVANGKQVDVIEIDWGRGFTPEMLEDNLKSETYDAVCFVHNETSTGVTNPVKEIADVVRQYSEDTLILVDTVSGIMGAEFHVDEWGVDIALTSTQKAFSLPPGMALASISDRVLERAKEVKFRGYYFDFLEIEKSLLKNNTPSTPPVSLMFALDKQLDDILAEGLENRWQRHLDMRATTEEWVTSSGFDFFAEEGFRSPTITAVKNTGIIDVMDLAKWMYAEKDFTIDKGYGKIKGETFRIAHMGDMTPEFLDEYLASIDEYLKVKA